MSKRENRREGFQAEIEKKGRKTFFQKENFFLLFFFLFFVSGNWAQTGSSEDRVASEKGPQGRRPLFRRRRGRAQLPVDLGRRYTQRAG